MNAYFIYLIFFNHFINISNVFDNFTCFPYMFNSKTIKMFFYPNVDVKFELSLLQLCQAEQSQYSNIPRSYLLTFHNYVKLNNLKTTRTAGKSDLIFHNFVKPNSSKIFKIPTRVMTLFYNHLELNSSKTSETSSVTSTIFYNCVKSNSSKIQ